MRDSNRCRHWMTVEIIICLQKAHEEDSIGVGDGLPSIWVEHGVIWVQFDCFVVMRYGFIIFLRRESFVTQPVEIVDYTISDCQTMLVWPHKHLTYQIKCRDSTHFLALSAATFLSSTGPGVTPTEALCSSSLSFGIMNSLPLWQMGFSRSAKPFQYRRDNDVVIWCQDGWGGSWFF